MAQVGQYQIGSFASPVNGGPLDATVVRSNDNSIVGVHDNHDNDPTIHVQSFPFASLPSASTLGRFLIASDTQRAYFDTGSVLKELAYLSTAGGTLTGALTTTQLTLSTAVSLLIPGATSFAIRNTANSANNLLLTDAGAATLRSSLTMNGTLSGVTTLTMSGDLTLPNGTSGKTYVVRSNVAGELAFIDNTAATRWKISGTGNFLPEASNTYTLGGASNRPSTVYGVDGNFSGILTVGSGATITGAILPSASATYDIGSSSARWNNAFFSGGFNTTGNVVIGTTLSVTGLSTLNKIKGGGSAPTPSGSNGTYSIATNSTDTAGMVLWTPTTTASSMSIVLTLTAAFPNNPFAVASFADTSALPAAGVFRTSSTGPSNVNINFVSPASDFIGGQTYKVAYQVIA